MADQIPDSTKLLPCPFCGADAQIERGSDHHGAWFNLGCSRHWGSGLVDADDGCIGGRIYYTETETPEAEAIAAWNTRAAPPAMDREAVERLRETVMEDEQLDGVRLSHSDALSILSALSADAIRQGEGSDQAFIFDVLEALKTHFPRIAFCFARGTGGIEREDVLAILNDTKTASGVGKATTEVAALVQWARDQMALPDGSGYLGGHIDENHRYKLRDLVNAIDATSWRLVQRTGLGDLPSRIQGWIGKARKQGRDRIELDFETVELLVRLATPASHASDGGEGQAERDRRMYEQGRRDERAGEPEAFS